MRKTEIVKITDEGRDKGKVFVLTEMPASRSEKWATRALLALAKSGVDLPTSVAGSGFAGIAVAGVKALNGLAFADAEPLMDEMFGCIEIRTAPDVVRPLVEDDIEEVMTRLKLRVNVLELHMGFSIADARLKSAETTPAASATVSTNTRTSHVRSRR